MGTLLGVHTIVPWKEVTYDKPNIVKYHPLPTSKGCPEISTSESIPLWFRTYQGLGPFCHMLYICTHDVYLLKG